MHTALKWESYGVSPFRLHRLLFKLLIIIAWTTCRNKFISAFTLPVKVSRVSTSSRDLLNESVHGHFPPLRMVEEEASVSKTATDGKSILKNISALITACYGLSLVGYGQNFPTQISVVSIAHIGGFIKTRKRIKGALKKGAIGALGTAIIRSPSLVFAKTAISESNERKDLAIKYKKEHAEAMADGTISKEEYKRLRKLRSQQVKLENRAIRRIKSARNFFTRTIHNANIRELKTILGDTVLMCTAIIASRQTSLLGSMVYRYYITLNMGKLFLEANRKIGYPFGRGVTKNLYIFDIDREELVTSQPDKKKSFLSPITHFFVSKLPFNTFDEEAEEVAAEEAAFVRNVGAILTYSASAGLVLFMPVLARKVNAALIASSLTIHGLSGLCNSEGDDLSVFGDNEEALMDPSIKPGLLRGGYGGQLTLGLTAASLVAGYLLEQNKLYVPKFFTPLSILDNHVDKVFDYNVI